MADLAYDVAVIGGGPAGMMAAGRAAECGARVILLEKNASLGRKLLISGGGRCNVTNAEFDMHAFLAKFGDSRKFLFSAFARHGVADTIEFFNTRGMPTVEEAEKRVFPASNSSKSVLDVLVAYMRKGRVTVTTSAEVTGVDLKEGLVDGVRLKGQRVVRARSYVLATGGTSHPETGSTGDGFAWLARLGHTVKEADAALVPIRIKDPWVPRLAGVSLQDVKLSAYQNGKLQAANKGKMLFTHFGVSGPLVLNMSREVRDLMKYGEVILAVDLMPQLDEGALDKQLQASFLEHSNKQIRNCLVNVVPPLLAKELIGLTGLPPDKATNIVTREERLALARLIKRLPMTVAGLMGVDKAIITSGGVDLREVDFRTMRSRKVANLFLVGDMLDIDRPSGGYSLQLCWTTGYVAGTSAAESSSASQADI